LTRHIPKKLIADEELAMTRAALSAHAEEWLYKTEVKSAGCLMESTEVLDCAKSRAERT
jgi:hypothetical protein